MPAIQGDTPRFLRDFVATDCTVGMFIFRCLRFHFPWIALTDRHINRRVLLNVIVRQGATVIEILERENQTLAEGRNTRHAMNDILDLSDGVRTLYIERHGLVAGNSDKYLHRANLFRRGTYLRLLWLLLVFL